MASPHPRNATENTLTRHEVMGPPPPRTMVPSLTRADIHKAVAAALASLPQDHLPAMDESSASMSSISTLTAGGPEKYKSKRKPGKKTPARIEARKAQQKRRNQ